jgi:hypothetical protein
MTYKFVKSMMERTNREVKIPVKFIEVYEEACRRQVGISDEFDESNLELRQHVRDSLLDNKLIFVDPNDVDSIYITQKAIDKYDKLPEEKW